MPRTATMLFSYLFIFITETYGIFDSKCTRTHVGIIWKIVIDMQKV
jgi:hypothetical protein